MKYYNKPYNLVGEYKKGDCQKYKFFGVDRV